MRPLLLIAVLFAACGPTNRDQTGDGGRGSGSGSGSGSGNGDGCSEAAKLVYVVDVNNELSKFDPATKTFTDVGKLGCQATFTATPFSMGVDRNAIAWVLYNDGELFRVDTANPSMCTRTTWASQQGLLMFGMGFSTNTAGGTDDTLFVAGGSDETVNTSKLATLSTASFAAMPVGNVTGWPELTGTGNAELWGWFPSNANGTSTPRVEQINKTSGIAMKTFPLTSLTGIPMAWAFAAWGGDFWIFYERGTETSTTVYQIDGMNGMIKSTTPAPGREIVGAGVSTCAPTVIL